MIKSAGITLLAVLVLAAGCGYSVVGAPSSPSGRRLKVALPAIDNQTDQAGVEVELTRHLRRELSAAGSFILTDTDHADYLIDARLTAANFSAVAFAGKLNPIKGRSRDYYAPLPARYRLKLVTRLRVIDIADDSTELGFSTFKTEQDFDYHEDLNIFSANRADAIDRAARDLARQIALRLAAGW